MKKFLEEFKAFALRGNVMDMAVGVIIGAAFSDIVTSFTNNIITPILNLCTHPMWLHFDRDIIATYVTNFIGSVVNFVIMAFILFCLMRIINNILAFGHKEAPEEPTQKDCPFCQTKISIKATRCPNCTSQLEEK